MIKKNVLALAFLAAIGSPAFAFYQNVVPPGGFSRVDQTIGGVPTKYMYQKSPIDTIVRGAGGSSMFRVNTALTVGGRAVGYPAAMRLSANAGIFLARAAFPHPALFLALGAGAVAYDYWRSMGFEVVDGVWRKKAVGSYTYYNDVCPQTVTGYTPAQICENIGVANIACGNYVYPERGFELTGTSVSGNQCTYSYMENNGVPGSSSVTFDGGESGAGVATLEEMEQAALNTPLPSGLPEGWPMAFPPLPVEKPVLNPNPAPEISPKPDPRVYPVGDPEPASPPTEPQTYEQPTVEIKPANTDASPWRVEATPKEKICSTPESCVDDPVDSPDPETTPQTQKTDCEKFPKAIGCSEYGTPEEQKLPTNKIAIKVEPKTFVGSASCPAPENLQVLGQSYDISYQPICDQLAFLRALMLAIAGVMAAYILADSFKVS